MAEQEKKKFKFKFPLWAKTLSVLIVSVAIISIVGINFFASNTKTITENFYLEEAVKTADALSIYLDLDDVKAVKNKVETIYNAVPEEQKVENSYWGEPEWETYLHLYDEVVAMPEYESLFKQLQNFHQITEARYTYIAYADLEHDRLVYLVDDSPEDERCLPGSFDDFTEQDMAIHDDVTKGFPPEITNMPEYGYLASTGRPIFDVDGEGKKTNTVVAFALADLSMDEIVAKEDANTRTLTIILISISFGAVLAGFLLVLFLIVRPMRILTKAANEYVQGDTNELNKFAKIKIKTADEIEDLANSMKKMEGDINHYIDDLLSTTTKLEGAEKRVDEMKRLADRDALTGAYNKRAYFEIEERLNDDIRNGKAKFAIVMIDLNDLKVTNDTLGHEKGDVLIIALSAIIKKVFTKSDIYRVGGDEFVVVCEGEDYKNIRKLERSFKLEIQDVSNEVNAAIGIANYDSSTDNNVEDTFKRADAKMYENKKEMKSAKK